jgi:hypothetical protein
MLGSFITSATKSAGDALKKETEENQQKDIAVASAAIVAPPLPVEAGTSQPGVGVPAPYVASAIPGIAPAPVPATLVPKGPLAKMSGGFIKVTNLNDFAKGLITLVGSKMGIMYNPTTNQVNKVTKALHKLQCNGVDLSNVDTVYSLSHGKGDCSTIVGTNGFKDLCLALHSISQRGGSHVNMVSSQPIL